MNLSHEAAISQVSRGPQFASEVPSTPDDLIAVTMDARAANLHQHRLIHDPSPEVDSLVEHVRELVKTATTEQREHLAAVLGLVRDLADSNHVEGELERAVAGAAEQMACEARERRMRDALGVKAIAKALRPPLDVIARPKFSSAASFVAAVRTVDDVIARVPEDRLLAVSVRHELGVRKFSLLTQLVHDRKAADA